MRGRDKKQHTKLSIVSPKQRIPADHPLRSVKKIVEQRLAAMSADFDEMYSSFGRTSIAPERLLKSMLLRAMFSVRSERLFCEQFEYNLLFRWFLNMSLEEPSFHPTTFSKNRARFVEHEVARKLFASVVQEAQGKGLMSDEHFSR